MSPPFGASHNPTGIVLLLSVPKAHTTRAQHGHTALQYQNDLSIGKSATLTPAPTLQGDRDHISFIFLIRAYHGAELSKYLSPSSSLAIQMLATSQLRARPRVAPKPSDCSCSHALSSQLLFIASVIVMCFLIISLF